MMWQSIYVFVDWPGDDVLSAILDELEQARRVRSLKRYFFIRYSEGGYHFRIRLLQPTGGVVAAIRYTAAQYGKRIDDSQRYSRSEHYFGESPLSVYSELLNEQTSILVHRYLSSFRHTQKLGRLLEATCLTARILAAFRLAGGPVHPLIAEGREFALRNMSDRTVRLPDRLPAALWNVFARAGNSFASECENTIRRIARLMLRLTHLDGGLDIAVHSLHLLHNKLGLGFFNEWTNMKLAHDYFQGDAP